MTTLGRVGDPGIPRGRIVNGAATVFCEGRPVGTHVSLLIHKKPTRTITPASHSATVFAEGRPVLRSPAGSLTVSIGL
jgi:hypothetical protein